MALASAYQGRIMAAIPHGMQFQPLMTLYLTDMLPPDEIMRAKEAGVVALKLYPAGATTWGAQQLAGLSDNLAPRWLLVLLMGLMGLLTNFVSNNAAAAIGTPLGIALARTLGVDPEPFVLAVLFGCNLCYLTPMGYQTNLLVMNAGGYRFGDFVRVGTPLFLIMWAALSYGVILRYQL